MKNKLIFYIISLLINILLCIGGFWTLLIGIFIMFGGFSEPSIQDRIIGLLFFIGTYLIAGLVNFVTYKIFKNKLSLGKKFFIVPTICIYVVGIIYTIVLFI